MSEINLKGIPTFRILDYKETDGFLYSRARI